MTDAGDAAPEGRRRTRSRGAETAQPDDPGAGPDHEPEPDRVTVAHRPSSPSDPASNTGDREPGATREPNLRGLVGAGPSLLTPATAMRVRDASRPSPEQVAAADTAAAALVRRRLGERRAAGERRAPGDRPQPDDRHQSGDHHQR